MMRKSPERIDENGKFTRRDLLERKSPVGIDFCAVASQKADATLIIVSSRIVEFDLFDRRGLCCVVDRSRDAPPRLELQCHHLAKLAHSNLRVAIRRNRRHTVRRSIYRKVESTALIARSQPALVPTKYPFGAQTHIVVQSQQRYLGTDSRLAIRPQHHSSNRFADRAAFERNLQRGAQLVRLQPARSPIFVSLGDDPYLPG